MSPLKCFVFLVILIIPAKAGMTRNDAYSNIPKDSRMSVLAVFNRLLFSFLLIMCERGDSNPHRAFARPDPKSGASANSATLADIAKDINDHIYGCNLELHRYFSCYQ